MIKFKDVGIGGLFRALKNDVVGQRIVNNNGLYLKVGYNVSVDLSKENVDCIFDMEMPCRLINTRHHINYASFPSYQACAKGCPA